MTLTSPWKVQGKLSLYTMLMAIKFCRLFGRLELGLERVGVYGLEYIETAT